MESIQRENLTVFGGLCCSYSLCYFDTPGCIGCAYEEECLCLGSKGCCKVGASPYWCTPTDEKACCQLGLGICALFLKTPTTLCKDEEQCCCLVGSCSFPPDKDMPCIVGSYGLTCYPKCGCCLKLSDVKK
eukprot:gene22173-28709_t